MESTAGRRPDGQDRRRRPRLDQVLGVSAVVPETLAVGARVPWVFRSLAVTEKPIASP